MHCPLLYSIATLGCRVFCCGDYYVSVICLEFGLFGYVCALCFVTFDIYVSARGLVFCSIVTLRCAALCCVYLVTFALFILCRVPLVTLVALSCVMFDC